MDNEVDMDINLDVKAPDGSFRSIQGQPSHRREQREVAIYLRNGSIWVGHFSDDHGELDFGDDRRDAAHGLGELLNSDVGARLNYPAVRVER